MPAHRLLALSCLAACAAMPIDSVMAACSPINPTNGATVTCSGAANPLAPSYASSADNLTVNVVTGGSAGVLLGLGGTAMSLTGNGTTLNNAGTIDPSLLGLLSLLSSGTVIGNPNLGTAIPGSTVTVSNQGTMKGTTGLLGLNLADLTGMALSVRNGGGGTTNITNSGTIGSSALLGVSLLGSDAPVVAAYGGAQVNFTNTGTITGRIAFESSAPGNNFINAGTISGSVSMGTNSTNTFTAVTGSDVNNGGSLGLNLLGVLGINLSFAPTGQIDGGAGGNNTLVLQNVVAGPGSGATGTGTASSATYINFQHLTVNSGTWSLSGALVSGDATLNGGVAQFDSDANFGSAASITSNGGGIAASINGSTLSKAITLNAGGLTATGGNNFTLSGVLSGAGALTKSGASTVSLSAAETYTGGTLIDGGTLALGANSSLTATGSVNLQNAGSTFDISGATANQTIGMLTGSAGTAIALGARTLSFGDNTNTTFAGAIGGTGGIVKQGSGVFTMSGASTYTGGTAIDAGTLAIGAGGSLAATGAVALNSAGSIFDLSGASTNQTIGALSGVAGSQVVLASTPFTLTLGDASNTTFAGTIGGTGGIVKQGAGTLTLSSANSYTGGTTVNAGTLAVGSGGSLAASGTVALTAPGSTLDLSAAGAQSIGALSGVAGSSVLLGANALTLAPAGSGSFGGTIGGTGGVTINGTGTETLTGANTYTGGTSIQSGTLALGVGGSLAAGSALTLASGGTFDISTGGNQAIGALAGAGGTVNLGANVLSLSGSGGGSFDGVVQGTGGLTNTANALVLNGANTYTGLTTVQGGSLTVGDATHAGATVAGDVSVASGASLGGFGTVGGSVTVQNGGHLAPGNPTGALTVNTDLALAQGSVLDFSFGAPGPNFSTFGSGHNVVVNGNLTINGAALNPIDAGGFGPGLYNLFTYGGTLTETNGGVVPTAGYTIQNLTASKQINLINANGLTLNFWNANGLASSTAMGGGSGTWSVPGANWTDSVGSITSTRQPADAFAIFGGASGTVTVDNTGGAVTALGMQFASNGYLLTGGALGLAAPSPGALSEIRVGDGSAASAGWIATIDNTLTGLGFNKTGAGTLVLGGSNTYTQGTMLSAGTLSVSADANLGAVSAGLDFEGGILQVTSTAFQSTARAITLGAPGGSFDIADAANVFTVSQAFSGSGGLTKLGAGTLVLSGANSYSGGTTVSAGTLQGDATSLQGNIVDNAALVFDQGANGTFAGSASGSGSLTKLGAGTLTLSGASSYSGGTIISAGALQGDTSSLQGNIADNASLIFNQGTDGTFGGVISGTGTLSKLGTGTVTLSGANTYSGGTTISAGALQGDTTSLQGNITDNASLIFNQGANGSFGGVISGTGALTKLGTGTVTLSGANTYSGGTTISAGALQGDTTSLQGNIADNASLIFNQGANGSFGGVISGTGSLSKLGTGTVTLSGANTYSGGTTISAGALQGDTTSLQGNITDNASLIFNQGASGTFGGVISGTGALTKLGAGTLTLSGANTYSGGTTISAGALQGDTTSLQGNITDNASLIFNQGTNGSFSGSLSGTGTLLKSGAGSLTFNGSNPFTGTTTVAAGMLIVGDNSHPAATLASAVTVNSGATLGGIGTIGALDLSGTVVPGNTTGTLSVTGNAVFRNGSSYQVGATPAGQGSLIAIGGNASILGGSVLVLAQPGNYAPRTNYTILTAAQGVTGQFGAVSANLTFLTPLLSYTANAVNLSLQRNDTSFQSVAQTPNQKSTAGALDHLDPSSPVYDALLDLDAPTARHAFDQLSGEIHASTRTAVAGNDDYVRDALNAHLSGQSNNANGLNVMDDHGVIAWTTVWGHWGSHDSDGNASDLNVNGSGFLVGADLPVGAARLGAVMSTGQGTARVATLGSSSHIVDQHLGIYGSMQAGGLQWQGGAIYGWQKVGTNRFIGFGTFNGTAVSSYHAHTAQAYADASLPFVHGGTTLAPFVNLAVERLSTPAIRENGTPAALDVAAQDSTLGYGTVGLRATFDLGAPTHGLHAHASVGWRHAWGDTLPVDTMRFESGSDSFAIAGLPALRNAGVINTGISFTVAPSVSVDASYQGQFGQHAKDQSARISLDWAF